MSTLEVNAIKSRTGTDITIESGASITGTASQFKITGGTTGQAIITDGSGGLSFGEAGSRTTISDTPLLLHLLEKCGGNQILVDLKFIIMMVLVRNG